MTPRIRNKTVAVRCLGPGPEHTFQSTDPKFHRICYECAVKIQKISGTRSQIVIKPVCRTVSNQKEE